MRSVKTQSVKYLRPDRLLASKHKPPATRRKFLRDRTRAYFPFSRLVIMHIYAALHCKRNIEMTPLCNIEVTLPRVLGSREVRRGGGVVDEQAGVRPS